MRFLKGALFSGEARGKALFWVFLASLLLTCVSVLFSPVMNRDGMFYVHLANLFLSGDAEAAYEAFDWPFFSVLIAVVSKISHLSTIQVAYGVSALFAAGLSVVLVVLLSRVSRQENILLAAFCVLMLPALNEYRAYVLRDWPAWFFMALSVLLALQNAERATWMRMASLAVCLICAALFRLEMLFLCIPLALFLLCMSKWKAGRLLILLVPSGLIAVFFFSFIYVYVDGVDARFFKYIGMINVFDIFARLQASGDFIGTKVLNEISKDYGFWVLFFGLITMVPVAVVGQLGMLCVAPMVANGGAETGDRKLYWALSLFWVFILVVFVLSKFFLSYRYVVPLSLSLLPLFYVCLLRGYQGERRKVVSLILFLFLVHGLSALISTKAYEKSLLAESGRWVGETLKGQDVYINDGRISFYAGRGYVLPEDIGGSSVENKKWSVVLMRKTDEGTLLEQMKRDCRVIRRFDSGGSEIVMVLKNNSFSGSCLPAGH